MPGPIEIELVSVPNLILNKARSIANSVNPTNDIVDIVSINALVNETDATERGIEYYLDINSKRLDFDFYSTLGPVDLVTVTTGPCYKSSQIQVEAQLQPDFAKSYKLHELTNVKLGKWYNAGVEDIIDLATKVVSKAFPTMSVQAIYLKPQISSIKFNPKPRRRS